MSKVYLTSIIDHSVDSKENFVSMSRPLEVVNGCFHDLEGAMESLQRYIIEQWDEEAFGSFPKTGFQWENPEHNHEWKCPIETGNHETTLWISCLQVGWAGF